MASTAKNIATARSQALAPARVARVVLASAALCVSAYLEVPLQPVPITMQVLALDVIALALAPGEVAAAVGSYLVIGALGAPVFSGAMGGMAKLLGPTGGFILGFVPSAVLASWLCRRLDATRLPRVLAMMVALLVATAVLYLFGWVWLMVAAGLSPQAAFAGAVAPFVLVDTLKAVIAACAVSATSLLARPLR